MQITTLVGVLFFIVAVISPCYPDSTPPVQRPSKNQSMSPPQAAEWSVARNWETEVMGVKVRGTAQRRENEIKGVLHIYPPLSDKWTYHWFGKIEGNKVSASHSDGHSFSGSITPERTVEGVVITKDGHRIPLKAPLP